MVDFENDDTGTRDCQICDRELKTENEIEDGACAECVEHMDEEDARDAGRPVPGIWPSDPISGLTDEEEKIGGLRDDDRGAGLVDVLDVAMHARAGRRDGLIYFQITKNGLTRIGGGDSLFEAAHLAFGATS